MNAEEDFLKDLLNDAMINARELRCRLDDQPEMIGLSDIVLSRVEQALNAIRNDKEQGKGNGNNNLRVLPATFHLTGRRAQEFAQR